MTKANVKRVLGIQTDADLGRIFHIGRGAVWLWPEDEEIPKARQWELRSRFPQLFPMSECTEKVA